MSWETIIAYAIGGLIGCGIVLFYDLKDDIVDWFRGRLGK